MPGKPRRKVVSNEDSISLNKYISDTGFCSRREADKYIDQARVTINDNVALPGNRVAPGDVVEVDGEPIGKKKATIYLAYNKPTGVTSTSDTKDRTNIIDAIGFQQRIFPIGRLDKDSEGLIFLTNDGNIVNKILRAGNEHEKEYIVTVDKPINPDFVTSMSAGVRILNEVTLPCKVVQEGKSTFRITLVQGLNRQIRRMCEALGFTVKMLKRVRIMNVHLASLKTGQWRYLSPEEVSQMLRMVSGSSAKPEAKVRTKADAAEKTTKAVEADPAVLTDPLKPAERTGSAKKKSYKEFRKGGRR